MKRIINVFVAICLLLSISVLSSYAENEKTPDTIAGKFKSSSLAFIGESGYEYTDEYFSRSAYIYDHQLAKMSLRLAMAAFSDNTDGYTKQYVNAENLLKEMKFSLVCHNADYEEKPTENSIGVIAGSKNVAFAGNDYTLIAVALRGGNYGAEWGGNFNVGDSDMHEGFKTARDGVIEFLKDYVADNKITGDVKVWVTGYSRGAATANLTGAYLDSTPDVLGSNIAIIPENIYTYCFATPAAVKNPQENEVYKNIFSIVNRNDCVPLVAMEKWGYGRFGNTYYLPSSETNLEYEVLESDMKNAYNSYVRDEYKFTSESKRFSEYGYVITIPFFNIALEEKENKNYPNMAAFLQCITDELATSFESPSGYVRNGQDALIVFGEKIIGGGRLAEFTETFKNEVIRNVTPQKIINMSGGSTVEDVIKEITKTSVKAAFEKMGETADDNVYDAVSKVFIALLKKNQLTTLIGNSDLIALGHYPEQYMAWLDAADIKDLTNKNGTFVVSRGIEVLLNDRAIKFDQPPIIKNDRTLVPLRAIFESLGATVEWDAETQTVTSVRDGKIVTLTIGSDVLHVNEKEVILDVGAQLINDRTLVPVRAVAESFDCNVDWNGETQTVIIYEHDYLKNAD